MEKEGGDGREKDSRTSSRMDDCIVYVSLSVSGCLSVSACLFVRLHRNIFKERDPMPTRRPQREKREGEEEEKDFFKETEQERGRDRANERLRERELPLFLPCVATPTLSLSVSPEASLGLVLALARPGLPAAAAASSTLQYMLSLFPAHSLKSRAQPRHSGVWNLKGEEEAGGMWSGVVGLVRLNGLLRLSCSFHPL